MARTSKRKQLKQLAVAVDDCRVRIQTGEPIEFVDARRAEDWAASAVQVAGAVRLCPEEAPLHLPLPKHNYIVVYCA